MSKKLGQRKTYFASLVGIFLLALLPMTAIPQEAENPDEKDLDAPVKVNPMKQKYLSLFIGIPYDEKLPALPPQFQVRGDYKKVTQVAISKELGSIRFTPTKEGVATLTIHDAAGRLIYEFRIDTKKSNLTKVAREIRALLSDVEGISVKIINNRVVVDGQILLPRDMNRIHSVIRQYDGLASTIVTLSPIAQKKIAQYIERDINNPEISVRAINDKFILEGSASQGDKDRAFTIAQMYVPDMIVETAEADGVIKRVKREAVVNLISVKPETPKDPPKTIRLVVHYVELNKDYERAFRFQWMPDIEDGAQMSFTSDSRTQGGVVSTIAGTVKNLLPKLNWAKQHGHARILESTSLIVLDQQKGDIRSMVRIPYSNVNSQGQQSTNFEEVGIATSITPGVLNARSDSVRLSLEFAFKNLVGMTSSGPMVSNHTMTTMVIVRSGQSAAIGGLISNRSTTGYNKLPTGVSKNPLISIYTSKDFARNQSQFVVFVTPIIVSSASAGAEKIKEKFRLRD